MNRRKTIITGIAFILLVVAMTGGWVLYEKSHTPWVYVTQGVSLGEGSKKFFINERTIKSDGGYVDFAMMVEETTDNAPLSHSVVYVKGGQDKKKVLVIKREIHYRNGRVETETLNKWFQVDTTSPMYEVVNYAWLTIAASKSTK